MIFLLTYALCILSTSQPSSLTDRVLDERFLALPQMVSDECFSTSLLILPEAPTVSEKTSGLLIISRANTAGDKAEVCSDEVQAAHSAIL